MGVVVQKWLWAVWPVVVAVTSLQGWNIFSNVNIFFRRK